MLKPRNSFIIVLSLIIALLSLKTFIFIKSPYVYLHDEPDTLYTIILTNETDKSINGLNFITEDDSVLYTIDSIDAQETINIEFDTRDLPNEYNKLYIAYKDDNKKEHIHSIDKELVAGFDYRQEMEIIKVEDEGIIEFKWNGKRL